MGGSSRSIADPLGQGDSTFSPTGQIGDPLDLFGTQAKNAADKAGDLVEKAAAAAAAEQKRQSLASRADQMPWLTAGGQALGVQGNSLGLNGAGAQANYFNNFNLTPGQAFLRSQQEKAMLANASRTGGLGGGNIRADLQQSGITGAMQNYETDYNRMAGISGTGQTSSNNLAGLGQASAQNLANLSMSAGDARSSSILAAQQMHAQNLGNAAGYAGTAYGMFGNNNSQPTNTATPISGRQPAFSQ